MNYEELTKEYSNDYFCEPMKKTLKLALILIESIKNGDFEYDTCFSDRLLYDLRYAVNEIDI